MGTSFLPFLHRVAGKGDLSSAEAEEAMSLVLSGECSVALLTAFLVAERMKGETASELVGFARAMRRAATRVEVPEELGPLADTCGTGGDGTGSFNISTVTAFVIAGAGVRVAKHGNRSISSRCGSADVMEGLGVHIGLNAAQMAAAICDVGIAFLFAPSLNPAMRHAMPARIELKMRTVFNLLGPLTNPAGAGVQVVGAPSEAAARLMADALAQLGLRSGWVVHAVDGMDEITTTGETLALRIRDGEVETCVLTPEEFGVPRASISDLAGGDLAANTEIAREILGGRHGPKRDAVLVNAAAALLAAERVGTLPEGVEMAARSIDSGAAASKLEALREFSVAAKSAS